MGKKPVAVKAVVPPALAKAVAKLGKLGGAYVYGLPGYTLDSKLRVEPVDLGDLELFDDNEVDRDEVGDFIPFAALKDEPQFLAIATKAPFAVGMWEHETGKIEPAWDSLAEFAAKRLAKKTDKTPFEKLEKNLDKASKLVEVDKYKEALALLEPLIETLPRVPPGRARFEDGGLSRTWNLYGLALKGVKRLQEAKTAFETARAAGDDYAMLNLLDMLEDVHEPKAVIASALAAREHGYFDAYCRIWIARYLAVAYAATGELAKGTAELEKSVQAYAVKEADKLAESRASIEKYIADGGPGAEAAKAYLAFYKPKTYGDVLPAQATANRAVWASLSAAARGKLFGAISKPKDGAEQASDADIARCLDVDSIYFEEAAGTFDDLSVFLKFPNLRSLSFYGDPDDLEPLKQLTQLESLTINLCVIKNFAFASRADRDFLAAAKRGDQAGVERALAAGARIHMRERYGENAVHLAAAHPELALFLVSRGCDPWATTVHTSHPALERFDAAHRPTLVAAAIKAGLRPAEDDPYRELKVKNMGSHATFENPTKLELEDGDSIAAAFPKGVKLQMRAPKKDHKLYDLHRVGYHGFAASERLADVLRGDNVELFPVTLVDHAGKVKPDKYFIVNPLQLDCIDLATCDPHWNHIDPDSITDLSAYAIDATKVGTAQFFRLGRLNSHPAIITKELAAKLAGFTGIYIEATKR